MDYFLVDPALDRFFPAENDDLIPLGHEPEGSAPWLHKDFQDQTVFRLDDFHDVHLNSVFVGLCSKGEGE